MAPGMKKPIVSNIVSYNDHILLFLELFSRFIIYWCPFKIFLSSRIFMGRGISSIISNSLGH